jgi:hypothetical protein
VAQRQLFDLQCAKYRSQRRNYVNISVVTGSVLFEDHSFSEQLRALLSDHRGARATLLHALDPVRSPPPIARWCGKSRPVSEHSISPPRTCLPILLRTAR